VFQIRSHFLNLRSHGKNFKKKTHIYPFILIAKTSGSKALTSSHSFPWSFWPWTTWRHAPM